MKRVVVLAGVALVLGWTGITASQGGEPPHQQESAQQEQPPSPPPPPSGGSHAAVPRAPARADADARRAPRVREPREAGDNGGRTPTVERTGDTSADQSRSGAGDRRRVPGTGSTSDASAGQAQRRVPPYSRPRNGDVATGTAVPRPYGGAPASGGHYGGYYSNYYWNRPYSHWGWAPWGVGFFWYDPWWGAGPGYYGSGQYYPGYAGGYADCAVKLKMRPREAQVFVDGYYAGIVDEFDGVFQKLRLDEGPHRIEVRMDGYEPQSFDVRVTFDHTLTLRGELRKLQP